MSSVYTQTLTFSSLLQIIMLCTGKAAARGREHFAHTLARVYGADASLITQMLVQQQAIGGTETQAMLLEGTGVTVAEANGQALVPTPSAEIAALDVEERRLRLRRIDMELQKDAMDLQERELKLRKDALDQSLSMSNVLKASSTSQDDERIRMALLDASKNTILLGIQGFTGSATPLLLTNGEGCSRNQPISISTVAAELKMKLTNNDLIAIGRMVAQRYRRRYNGQEPSVYQGVANGHTEHKNVLFKRQRSHCRRFASLGSRNAQTREKETEKTLRVDTPF